MEFGFSEEQERFRQEVRDFCESEPWGEIVPIIDDNFSPSFYRKVADKGWLGLQFPERYGGKGKDAIWETIFSEEMGYCGAPIGPSIYGESVICFGDMIAKYGSEQLKEEYLPRIAKGEISLGQAITEPEAGSDEASVQTRAIRKGDYYIVNGQKMFWTYVHVENNHSLLMARTDPNALPEKGISLFIVDNKTPGISYTPLVTMGGRRTNQVFLDDVKIPRQNLLGEENRGWHYFMQSKAVYWHKGQAGPVGRMSRLFDTIIQYTKETESNGHSLSQNPLVRQKLAQMATEIRVRRLLIYRLAWMESKGLDALPIAAILKVINDEASLRFASNAMQILGLYGQLEGESKYAPLRGTVEGMYQAIVIMLFVDGGASVTRNFIATHVLGLDFSRIRRHNGFWS